MQDGDNFFFETNTNFCRNGKRYEPGMNCFYMPYSKCTIKDATAKVGTLSNWYFLSNVRCMLNIQRIMLLFRRRCEPFANVSHGRL